MGLGTLLSYLIPLIYISPAYATNAAPLFLSNILEKRRPLDFYKKIGNERILGDGKTIEGTLFGIAIGYSYFLIIFYFDKQFNILNLYKDQIEGLMLILGSIVGDVIGSFIKRRMGLKRGEMLPVFDQTGFLIFAILFRSLLYGPLSYDLVVYLFIVTFLVHILTNVGAFEMGIKKEPI